MCTLVIHLLAQRIPEYSVSAGFFLINLFVFCVFVLFGFFCFIFCLFWFVVFVCGVFFGGGHKLYCS